MSYVWHKRATAAFFKPNDHSVRASSLALQSLSGIEPPRVIPVPSQDPPPLTEPKQLSMPAAAKPGAKTDGTVDTELWPCVVTVCAVWDGAPAIETVPPWPPTPTPTPPCPPA